MTDLRKPVRRRAVEPTWRGRRVVVMLEPGDVIAFREERTRRWYRAPINKLFLTVAKWNVDAERAAKRASRKNGLAK